MPPSFTSISGFSPQANAAPDKLMIEVKFENELRQGISVDNDLTLKLFRDDFDATPVAVLTLTTGPEKIERKVTSLGSIYYARVGTDVFMGSPIRAEWYGKIKGQPFTVSPIVQFYRVPSVSNVFLSSIEVRDFILSKLGFPVVDVELSNDQLATSIDQGLRLYNRWIPKFKFGSIQLIAGKTEYDIPEFGRGILDVQYVRKEGIPLISDPLFGREYPRGQQLDFDQYVLGTSFFKTLLTVTGQDLEWKWEESNPTKLYIQAQAQSYVIAYAYAVDKRIEEISPAHHELFLRISLMNAKGILGEVREKYGEVPAPAGKITLNGAQLKKEYADELKENTEDLRALQPPVPPTWY